jgi:hypothetical protein
MFTPSEERLATSLLSVNLSKEAYIDQEAVNLPL